MEKNRHLGIKPKEVLWVFLFYLFFSFFYSTTINFSAYGFTREAISESMDPMSIMRTSGLHYILFLIASIPIWYLIFRVLRRRNFKLRLLVHLFTWPIFVIGTQQSYYLITNKIGWGHLEGPAQAWDLYIPALFYLIQFGILHAYEHYRENQRKLILEGELRQAALKSELAAIKAQLNPHFLYNVFNTINASVPAENESTRQMIAQLSDLFRYQLQATKVELVPLREELAFVKKYLDLEKARFEERLKIDIDVAEDLMDEEIPPMLLQPLVENSVKHGLSSLIDGGTISIKIFKEGEKLKFEISDTGIGIKGVNDIFNKGVGLANTRVRLQKMYQSQLELIDNDPSGLKIRFAI